MSAPTTEEHDFGDYESALQTLVSTSDPKSSQQATTEQGAGGEGDKIDVHAPAHQESTHGFLGRFVPSLKKVSSSNIAASPRGTAWGLSNPCRAQSGELKLRPLRHCSLVNIVYQIEYAAKEHVGNLVATKRGENPPTVWESMPIYVRLGMQALYHGRAQELHLLSNKRIENLLREQSIKQGQVYDSSEGALEHIQSFVKTYNIDCASLEKPNIADYKTFNEFFYRKLRQGERKPDKIGDESVISSAADCRLTVFENVAKAKEYWIKGHNFTLANLLQDESMANSFEGGAVAVFRLAPADYHRYHSPVRCIVGPTKHIEGQYYTVNPVAINEDLDVFTENKRDVTLLSIPKEGSTPLNVAFVAVGAMLVGSIVQTANQGDEKQRGDELGYFAYGGSTVICVFPANTIKFDDDLLRNSSTGHLETAVKVGEQIGVFL